MILEEFQREIFESALNSSTCSISEIRHITPTSINIRIPLIYGNFIDIFFNEETGTTAFALIENNKRIFGVDNTGGWHLHPFKSPDAHQEIAEPLSFIDFLQKIEDHYKSSS